MSSVVKSVLAACALLAGLGVSAQAADLSVGGDDGSPCADQRYLAKISARFDYQVRNVPNLPDVAISDFRNIHQHRYIPDSEDWPIARRYCGATVVLSDGRHRELWYLIEGRMGFVGIGENVEFCVSGFDRWYVYNGRCRVLR